MTAPAVAHELAGSQCRSVGLRAVSAGAGALYAALHRRDTFEIRSPCIVTGADTARTDGERAMKEQDSGDAAVAGGAGPFRIRVTSAMSAEASGAES